MHGKPCYHTGMDATSRVWRNSGTIFCCGTVFLLVQTNFWKIGIVIYFNLFLKGKQNKK